MKRNKTGIYIPITNSGEKCMAFIPDPLPPKPPIELTSDIQKMLDNANVSLGRLDSIAMLLPETELLLYMYIRKEAVLSSQIEGTQSSLSDLLKSEITDTPGIPVDDIKEVSNYVVALSLGIKKIKNDFPVSSRLLKELHAVLLRSGRGKNKQPGEYRRSQNWIGGSRPGNANHVPPPHTEINKCMGDLEKFINGVKTKTPTLLKAALAHVQFETIHPFLDGNGRIGRLLIPLILYSEEVLSRPILYLSLFFKNHRSDYYQHLQKIRTEGDWESWIVFFSQAVKETAEQAVATAKKILALAESDREKIGQIKRISGSALKVHHAFLKKPFLKLNGICKITKLYPTSVSSALRELQKKKIIKEITGAKRNRIYCYQRYINLLNEGTEI